MVLKFWQLSLLVKPTIDILETKRQKDKYKRKKFFNFYFIFSSERFSPNRKKVIASRSTEKVDFETKKKIVIISKNLD
jgi:hypothetical protein